MAQVYNETYRCITYMYYMNGIPATLDSSSVKVLSETFFFPDFLDLRISYQDTKTFCNNLIVTVSEKSRTVSMHIFEKNRKT